VFAVQQFTASSQCSGLPLGGGGEGGGCDEVGFRVGVGGVGEWAVCGSFRLV
jgi:hypothetical protein